MVNWCYCLNFGVPDAAPIEDVIVAFLLSILSISIKKIIK